MKKSNPAYFSYKTAVLALAFAFIYIRTYASGEAGTYFNIYLPPANEIEHRDVALIVTAIENNTTFHITDTGEDGDTDDSASGTLKAGQSYILYMREGSVNDDAPHADEASSKQDGDHFIITASKLVLVAQAYTSDWQHNWLPATNKSSKGQQFFIYSNPVTTSPNDINVMAFQEGTSVTIKKISKAPTFTSGYTQMNTGKDSTIIQKTLAPGKDLIYYFHDGRDALKPGESYVITANKDITVQYGALYTDEHDGGGYVPSSNGSSVGELFYFAVPFEDSTQQEVRIISWDNNNTVTLERYNNGQWTAVKNFGSLNRYKTAEWVGKTSAQTFATIFRVRCTSGKNVSVVEDNWVETGGMGTSDIATMVSSSNGTSAGTDYLVYMPVPSRQGSMLSPITLAPLPAKATHLYIYGNNKHAAHVTVKDAFTNGTTINRSYTIAAGSFADCVLDSVQWLSIYNGTGTAAGGAQRPYLHIASDQPIAVMASNSNDNCMMYFGSSMSHSSNLSNDEDEDDNHCNPGDNKSCYGNISCGGGPQHDCHVSGSCDDGVKVTGCHLVGSTHRAGYEGTFTYDSVSHKTFFDFPVISQIDTGEQYTVQIDYEAQCMFSTGLPIANNTVVAFQTFITSIVDSAQQTASASSGVVITLDSTQSPFTLSTSEADTGEMITAVAGFAADNYQWDLDNGTTQSGNSIVFSYSTPGQYEVSLTVISQQGCPVSSSQTINVGNTTTAVQKNTEYAKAKVWGFDKELRINFAGDNTGCDQLELYSLTGQLLYIESHVNVSHYIKDFHHLADGYYLVVIKNNNQQQSTRVLL